METGPSWNHPSRTVATSRQLQRSPTDAYTRSALRAVCSRHRVRISIVAGICTKTGSAVDPNLEFLTMIEGATWSLTRLW